ncbi:MULTISPECIES: hypothetical protein [Methanobacterium]|nr:MULTISPECIES: hypothetical protein [Methanobacterium]
MAGTYLRIEHDHGKNTGYVHISKEGKLGAFVAKKKITKRIDSLTFNSEDIRFLYNKAHSSEYALQIYDKKTTKPKFIEAIESVQDQYYQFIDGLSEYKEQERQQEIEERMEELEEKSSEFKTLIDTLKMSLMEYIFYAGEWLVADESTNIAAAFTAFMATVLGLDPIWVTIFGSPGSGKTTIEEAALSLIPDSNKVPGIMTYPVMFDLTAQFGEDYFDRKVAVLGDLGGQKDFERNEEVINVFKELGTDEKPAQRTKNVKDPVTGEMTPRTMSIRGKSALSLTSVKEMRDEQMISRSLMLNPRSTDDMFLKFMEKLTVKNKPTKKRSNIKDNELPLLRAYLELFAYNFDGSLEVINPYYLCLVDWFKGSENLRRVAGQIPNLVKVVTLLHADERRQIRTDEETFVISTKFDNQIVSEMFNLYIGLSPGAINFYNQLIMPNKLEQLNEDELTELLDHKVRLDECKSLFTVSSIKRKFSSKPAGFQRELISSYCQALEDKNKLVKYDEYRSKYNLYSLAPGKPKVIKLSSLTFDDKLITKYVKDNVYGDEGVCGVSPEILDPIIQHDDTGVEVLIDKVKLPPWSSMIHKVWQSVAERGKSVAKQAKSVAGKNSSVASVAKSGEKPNTKSVATVAETKIDENKALVDDALKNWGFADDHS